MVITQISYLTWDVKIVEFKSKWCLQIVHSIENQLISIFLMSELACIRFGCHILPNESQPIEFNYNDWMWKSVYNSIWGKPHDTIVQIVFIFSIQAKLNHAPSMFAVYMDQMLTCERCACVRKQGLAWDRYSNNMWLISEQFRTHSDFRIKLNLKFFFLLIIGYFSINTPWQL